MKFDRNSEAAAVRPFATGDVVMLKSGGVPMTVSDQTINPDLVDVHWHSANGMVQRDSFHPAALRSIPEPGSFMVVEIPQHQGPNGFPPPWFWVVMGSLSVIIFLSVFYRLANLP